MEDEELTVVLRVFRVVVVVVALPSLVHEFQPELTVLEDLGSRDLRVVDELDPEPSQLPHAPEFFAVVDVLEPVLVLLEAVPVPV